MMEKSLVLASNNKGKLREFQAMFAELGVEVINQGALGVESCPEPFGTFIENCLAKARHAAKVTGRPAMADDSGICVNALNGMPGVYSARFAGEHGHDAKNNQKLLDLLKDVPKARRTARFVSAVACVFPDGRELTVRGTCEGLIGYVPKGENGFGYDPLFYRGERTFAEFSAEEKDAVSHRGNALRALAKELPNYL